MELLTLDPLTLAYHELRSPLGLLATAARAAAETANDDDLRRRCETMARAAERMLRTTERVLDLASRSQPRASAIFSPVETVRAVVSDLAMLGSRVRLEVAPSAGGAQIAGDPAQLEALVQSLISNAFDHADDDAEVRVRIDAPGDEVLIAVTNEVASDCRHRGLGVGAYLCRNLAAQIGGVLRVGPEGSLYRAMLALPLAAVRNTEH